MENPSEPSMEPLPPARSHLQTMGRALFSAAFFGVIGYHIGRWLGIRGNEPNRRLAAPIMKWGLGIFSAVLAAYSSFKASERVEKEQADAQMDVAAADTVVQSHAALDKRPEAFTTVMAEGAQHEGTAVRRTQQQIA